jgi:hypothetical protein
MRSAAYVPALLAAAVAACSSFGSESAPSDAGPPATPDAEAPKDASDASAQETGVPFVCPTGAFQCFDFEKTADPADGWTRPRVVPPGTLTRDQAIAKFGFAAVVTAEPGGGARLVMEDVPWTGSQVAIETDFYAEEFGGGIGSSGQVLSITNDNGSTLVLLYATAGASFLQEFKTLTATTGEETVHADLAVPLPKAKWTRLRLELSLTPPAKARLSVDGTPTTVMELKEPWKSSAPVIANIGLGYVTPGSSLWKYRYDNVVVGAP